MKRDSKKINALLPDWKSYIAADDDLHKFALLNSATVSRQMAQTEVDAAYNKADESIGILKHSVEATGKGGSPAAFDVFSQITEFDFVFAKYRESAVFKKN